MILLLVALLAADEMVKGIVKDSAGRPAPAVRVTLAVRSIFDAVSVPETTATTTDSHGKFSLKQPASLGREYSSADVIAHDKAHGIAAATVLPSNPVEIELQFGSAKGNEVTVIDADGKLVPGATLTPTRLSGARTLASVVGDQFAIVTDAAGRARFPSLDSKQIAELRVATRGGTAFMLYCLRGPADWMQVKLPPLIFVRGKFAGVPLPKDSEVVVQSSLSASGKKQLIVTSETRVRPAADGSFNGLVLGGGSWSVRLKTDDAWVTNATPWEKAKPNASEKTWNVAATVPITGVVRAQGGELVRGAGVEFWTTGVRKNFSTDADGRYSGRLPAGKLQRHVLPPMQYESERREADSIEIAPGLQTVELSPITVTPTAAVSGVVLDGSSKPVGGALVMAACTFQEGNGTTTRYRRARTTAEGAFQIIGVPRSTSILVRAYHPGIGAYSDGMAAVQNANGVKLNLKPSGSAPLIINVVDDAGNPIESSEVRLEVRGAAPEFGWLPWLRTEVLNTMKKTTSKSMSLGMVPKSLSYQVNASAEGHVAGISEWVPGSKLDTAITVTLRRSTDLAGRVVDTSGKAIAGATVKPAGVYGSDAEVITDYEGRFNLVGLPATTTVVTVQKPGFRYSGGIGQAGKPMLLTMKRPDEPAPRPMLAAYSPSQTEIAKRLMDPLADAVFGPKGSHRSWWGQSYAYIDPAKFLELVDAPHWKADERDFCRHHLAAALATTDLDEAIAQANAIAEPNDKAGALLAISKRLPTAEKDRRLPLLADALTAARGCTEPARRALYLANVGEALFLNGDANGEKVLREAEAMAKKLTRDGWAGYAVGSVGESLALIDFTAAMELTKDLPGDGGETITNDGRGAASLAFNRHRGNMAHKIAGRQPENAEKAFLSINDQTRRSRYAARVCYRMAPVDLVRARRLATHAKDAGDKMVCLASMAAALGAKRKAESLPLLRDAFTMAPAESHYGHESGNLQLALVSLAAAVASDETDDFFWQALASPASQRISNRSSYAMGERQGAIGVAVLLAQRFDADVAAALAVPLRAEIPVLIDRIRGGESNSDSEITAIAALLATSPETADEVLTHWPAPAGAGPQVHPDYVRYSVSAILFRSPKARNDGLIERFLNQWVIDKEDL